MIRILILLCYFIFFLAFPVSAQMGAWTAPTAWTTAGSSPCDSIPGGCAAAYSTTHSLVSSYAGALFELVQNNPVWTGTGYISGTTFTVSSTATGSLASSGVALSAPGSGTTPALTPLTHIVSGSGPYTVDKSQTAGSSGSPLTMKAYKVYDVPQLSNHAANLSNFASFCENTTCLVEILFNEASTGSANDLIASNVNAGNLSPHAADCTASIVTCAPLVYYDTTKNVLMAVGNWSAGLETCGGAAGCATSVSGLTGNTAKSVLTMFRPDMYTTCCGEFGLMEPGSPSPPPGVMFAVFTNLYGTPFTGCTVATEWCMGADLEGAANLSSYSNGTSQRNWYEIRYDGTTLSYYLNNSSQFSGSPATTPATSNQIHLFLAGDRSTAPGYFYDGLITADHGDHTAAYNAETAFYAGLSTSTGAGPQDVAIFPNSAAPGSGNAGWTGTSLLGYSLRCLSKSYTGPVADLTDSVTSVTNTYGCINGVIDSAAQTFCATNGCLISGLYPQGFWSPAGTVGNGYDLAIKLTATGSARPSATFNSLNGEPTMHFSGAQCLLATGLSSARQPLQDMEAFAVARRTGTFTSYSAALGVDGSLFFTGFSNAANTAQYNNGAVSGVGATTTASDSHWHSIIGYGTTTSAGTIIIDGAAGVSNGTNNASGKVNSWVTVGCGWSGSAVLFPLTGDVAEAGLLIRDTTPAGNPTDYSATIFANQQAFWGTLPN